MPRLVSANIMPLRVRGVILYSSIMSCGIMLIGTSMYSGCAIGVPKWKSFRANAKEFGQFGGDDAVE